MKEKEKGKGHPFAGHLHDDEEILWMSSTSLPIQPLRDGILYWCGACFLAGIFVLGLMILFVIGGLPIAHEALTHMIGIPIIVSLIAAIGVGILLTINFLWESRHPMRQFYAITNKRVLSYHTAFEGVPSLNLEDLSTYPRIEPGEKLAFTNQVWVGLEDAAYVKTMIEQAQKHRLEESRS